MICTASVEDRVPPFLRNTGKGWVTAEYGMLPRATSTRMQREASQGKVGGRTQEIQRLIGRSLRSVTNLPALGERTIWIDCDVIQADGGTRTASITGAFVALALALEKLRERDVIRTIPLADYVAAISVGIVDGEPLLDLAYEDDSRADVDMNIVKTGDGRFIEVQGTAEAMPFGREALLTLLDLADRRHPAARREAARHRRAPREESPGMDDWRVTLDHRPRRSARCWRSRRATGLCALEFDGPARHASARTRGCAAGFRRTTIVEGDPPVIEQHARVAGALLRRDRAPTAASCRSKCTAPHSSSASGAPFSRSRREYPQLRRDRAGAGYRSAHRAPSVSRTAPTRSRSSFRVTG